MTTLIRQHICVLPIAACEQVYNTIITVIPPSEAGRYEKKKVKHQKVYPQDEQDLHSSPPGKPLILVSHAQEQEQPSVVSPSQTCQKCHVLDVDDGWYDCTGIEFCDKNTQ